MLSSFFSSLADSSLLVNASNNNNNKNSSNKCNNISQNPKTPKEMVSSALLRSVNNCFFLVSNCLLNSYY